MRHSVGSSADVLLTPIRGSTVIADDFVFLPTSHFVEVGDPDEMASSSGSESPESPGPTIATLLTESEIHHSAERELLVADTEDLGPHVNTGGPPVLNNNSDDGLRPSNSLVSPEPPTPETPTVAKPIFEHHHARPVVLQEPVTPPSVPATPKPAPPPVIALVKCPVPRVPLPTPPPTVRAPSSTRPSAKTPEPRNVVPFPVGRPQSIALSNTDVAPAYSPPSEIYEHPLTIWIFAAWDTTTGIIILAMECYQWLARKGMRGDFRSCLSVWFLREVTIGLLLPLFMATITLWWLLRTLYPSYDISSMPA